MKRSSLQARRGIALVITLIMLSVVTITALAFLAVSRRDRNATVATGEQTDARFLADAALNRAKAEVAAGIAAASNRFAYGFFVSTNYINPLSTPANSFLLSGDENSLTNVNYYITTDPQNPRPFNFGNSDERRLYRQMLANLYYSPRVPVFAQTNRDLRAATEFRFYLDLNRNGRFESNGWVQPIDTTGRTNGFAPQWMVGDPEWIGILQHPDLPHSGTNLFVGRVAYLVAPAGRTLDWNFIHNSAKISQGAEDRFGAGQSPYMRNEGVGSWELNLAGFFSDLNTNVWSASRGYNQFRYETALNTPSTGLAFDDASQILKYRRSVAGNIVGLNPSRNFLSLDSGASPNSFDSRIRSDRVDLYSDGPIAATQHEVRYGTPDNDLPNQPWFGSDFTNAITDFNQLFDPNLAASGFANRVRGFGVSTSNKGTYDNYTFYRLLGQLGSDTADARFESGFHPNYVTAANPFGFYRRAKLNLNYAMDNPDGGTPENARVVTSNGLRDWTPIHWFTNAASRLLMTEFTNGLPFKVVDSSGTRFNPGLAVAGVLSNYPLPILVTTGNQTRVAGTNYVNTNYVYNGQVHRLLQVAANIYDYTTNRYPISPTITGLPTVFRPYFYRDAASPKVIRLGGYSEVYNWSPEFLRNWYDGTDPLLLNALGTPAKTNDYPDLQTKAGDPKVLGIPWVIGAKKGLPSFHEAFWQSSIQLTRRLLFVRNAPQTVMATSEVPFSGGNSKGFETLAQYRLRITNSVAIDAFYGYTNPLPMAVQLHVTNYHSFTLRWQPNGSSNGPSRVIFNRQINFGPTPIDVLPNKWVPLSYVTALNTGAGNNLVYDLIYDPVYGTATNAALFYNGGFVRANDRNTGRLIVQVTNSMVFAITAGPAGRVLDFVTLQSVMLETNVLRFLGETVTSSFGTIPIAGSRGVSLLTAPDLWATNQSVIFGSAGISNQFRVATKRSEPPGGQWVNALGGVDNPLDRDKSIAGLNYFLYHTPADQLDKSTKAALDQALSIQAGFNPSATVFLTDRRMANDPLVHYTADDLLPGYSAYGEPGGYAEVVIAGVRRTPKLGKPFTLDAKVTTNQVGLQRKVLTASAPWGTNANYGYFVPPKVDDTASSAYDMAYKDPGISGPDDWIFPTNRIVKFSNIGQLGRVHRGTPWQTIYLKSASNLVGSVVGRMEGAKTWAAWAGNTETYPAKDRNLLDLFTTALNDNAARGLMGVNQTNPAAWSALLSGVPLLQNTQNRATPQLTFVQPASPELSQILVGYTNSVTREIVPGLLRTVSNTNLVPGGYFPSLGSILATPTLTERSPFLNVPTNSAGWKQARNLTDEVVERLPQQVLSLVKSDEPRVVVYSYAQTLKPAVNSLVTLPGVFFGLCTNYQVTGEYATKTVLRFDGPPRDLKAVVEDHRVIYPGN